VEQFGKEGEKVRLLLASDVASEGLNLHFRCHRLVHFDVPWSLMVFAQRNGRIDRYGQEQSPQIVYLLTDTRNEKIRGDMRILQLLSERDDQAQTNIGDPSALMGKYDEKVEIKGKLNKELARLEALRNRRFTQEVLEQGKRDKAEIQTRVNKVFDPFLRFVKESMTAGNEPFIEVLAVFRHEDGYQHRTARERGVQSG
jgi:superfamily II DNA/RNA helicase